MKNLPCGEKLGELHGLEVEEGLELDAAVPVISPHTTKRAAGSRVVHTKCTRRRQVTGVGNKRNTAIQEV